MNSQPVQPYLGIGEVLVQLRPEFDITVSKIRFLESEGLIAPARSPSGYRRFSPSDVERLRIILTAQRDQYLPLRVIKERLLPSAPAASTGAGRPRGAADSRTAPAEMVSRRELLEAAGIDEAQLAELEAHGLVRRVGRLYGQDALDVAATVSALASYGVQPRHLRAVRTAAERETSLIEQVVAPTLRQRSHGAKDTAARTAREVAALLLRLHQALVQAALTEAGLGGGELSGPEDSSRADAPAGRRADGADGRYGPGPARGLPGGLADRPPRPVEGASA